MREETYRDIYIVDRLLEHDYGNASSVDCRCTLPVWSKMHLILQLIPVYKIQSPGERLSC